MTQFKEKMGKIPFKIFENSNYQWFRYIPKIIDTFYVVIESRTVEKKVIDQHCWPVGWLPNIIWPTAFLAKKKTLFVQHFWLASQCLTSKFE